MYSKAILTTLNLEIWDFSAYKKFEGSLLLRFSVFVISWQKYTFRCITCKRLLCWRYRRLMFYRLLIERMNCLKHLRDARQPWLFKLITSFSSNLTIHDRRPTEFVVSDISSIIFYKHFLVKICNKKTKKTSEKLQRSLSAIMN